MQAPAMPALALLLSVMLTSASSASVFPGRRCPTLLGFQQLGHAGDIPSCLPAAPKQGHRSAAPPSGEMTQEWRREYVRRSEVNDNFQMMRGMVQATWVFVLCALPLAIRHPGLQYRFMGGACRMFAGATTGVVLLGSGQQLLQSSVAAVVGLPDCWRHAAVPMAAVSARVATGFLAKALVQGPFFLDAPARAAVSRLPGGTLLNLFFLGAGMHQIAAQRDSEAPVPVNDKPDVTAAVPLLEETSVGLFLDTLELPKPGARGPMRIGVIGGGPGDGCLVGECDSGMVRTRTNEAEESSNEGALLSQCAEHCSELRALGVGMMAASSAASPKEQPAIRNRHVYRPRPSGVLSCICSSKMDADVLMFCTADSRGVLSLSAEYSALGGTVDRVYRTSRKFSVILTHGLFNLPHFLAQDTAWS